MGLIVNLKNHYKSEVRLFLTTLIFGLFIGLSFGYALYGLVLGLLSYIGWNLYQVKKLDKWLLQSRRDEKPELTGIFSYLVDRHIRLQRQHELEAQLLRSSLDRQKLLISEVKDGVVLIDDRDRIKWFNKSAAKLIRLNPDRDLGIPIRGAIRQAVFHAYYESGDYSEAKRICFDEHTNSWLEISITEYENNEKLLAIRDASMLQELEDMRRDFIANLSHELRTPVTVLVGYLETLEIRDQSDPTSMRIHKEMSKQCNRIAALLTDLLTLSKLETVDSKRTTSIVNISPILEQISADACKLKEFDGHRIKARIEPDLRVSSTESDMISAFSNLIYNAVRHNPAGTEISINAKSKQGMARIEIVDKGLGIERQHLHRLTERFYRVESSRNSAMGGTGLGLAIVKHALLRGGGKLKIKSAIGKGSSFRCLLPLIPEKKD